jgi:hypothetical protein
MCVCVCVCVCVWHAHGADGDGRVHGAAAELGSDAVENEDGHDPEAYSDSKSQVHQEHLAVGQQVECHPNLHLYASCA